MRMRRAWIDIPLEGGLLHARTGLPDRWDIWEERVWTIQPGQQRPGLHISQRRLARSIRQDLWRGLQNVRGFVPRVQVGPADHSLKIKAGGVLMASHAASGLGDRIAAVLDHPDNKIRWLAFASTKGD